MKCLTCWLNVNYEKTWWWKQNEVRQDIKAKQREINELKENTKQNNWKKDPEAENTTKSPEPAQNKDNIVTVEEQEEKENPEEAEPEESPEPIQLDELLRECGVGDLEEDLEIFLLETP